MRYYPERGDGNDIKNFYRMVLGEYYGDSFVVKSCQLQKYCGNWYATILIENDYEWFQYGCNEHTVFIWRGERKTDWDIKRDLYIKRFKKWWNGLWVITKK